MPRPQLSEWLPLIAIPLDLTVPSTPAVDRIGGRFRRAQLARAVSELVAALTRSPTVFIIEDAHWIDEASRDLLAEIIIGAARRPCLFLVTRRPADAPLFADLDPESVTIVLDPLSEDAASKLALEATAGNVLPHHELAALASRSGGNPLFVREIVAARAASPDMQDLPESLEALINAQIDRLPAADRRLLRYASVVGPTFNARLLAETIGDAPEAARWDRLDEFVSPEGRDAYRFKHALIREAAYAGLPFRRRRDLHERLALNIEGRYGRRADLRAELLSLHFFRAGSYEKALRYSAIAGDRAREKYANVEAAEFYRRAIDAARQIPPPMTPRWRTSTNPWAMSASSPACTRPPPAPTPARAASPRTTPRPSWISSARKASSASASASTPGAALVRPRPPRSRRGRRRRARPPRERAASRPTPASAFARAASLTAPAGAVR